MKFHIHGTEYELPALDDATTRELRTIKENTGMGLRSLMEGFYDMDPGAIVAVVWLAKHRAGEPVNWSDLEDLRPMKDVQWPEPEESEAEGGKPDPPTRKSTGSGTSRTRGSGSTSRSSRTTSTSPPDT